MPCSVLAAEGGGKLPGQNSPSPDSPATASDDFQWGAIILQFLHDGGTTAFKPLERISHLVAYLQM